MSEETKKQERQTFVLDNGQEASRAEFIRQEFQKDRSRKEVAEELGVSYNIVFSATANMFNSHHTEDGGGRGRATMVTHPDTGEQVSRAELMRELYEGGKTRAEVALQFEVPYATVYGATKDATPPEGARQGGKVMISHPESGEEVARIDYIREEFAKGKTRREIADAAGCDYSIVWMATREAKDADEEGEEAEVTEETPDYE